MSQANGVGAIEQAIIGAINQKIEPEVEKINDRVASIDKKSEEIDKKSNQAILEANKSVEKAKSIVENTFNAISVSINKDIGDNQKSIKGNEELIAQNMEGIGVIASRVKNLEQNILGITSLVARDDGKPVPGEMEFELSGKPKSISYYVDNQKHLARFVDGKFTGPHLVSSSTEGTKCKLKFEKALDQDSEFSVQYDMQSLDSRVAKLEAMKKDYDRMKEHIAKIPELVKSIDRIENFLISFAELVNGKE